MLNQLERPAMTELPAQAERLLGVLKMTPGEWVDRGDIAAALGKSRLNPAEVAYLEMLAVQGRIEAREVPTSAPSQNKWVYRAN